jgi:DUF4097 and DUF4098 domain-containing protein YvlB
MLEEGKITSEEAAKLLEALDSGSRQASSAGEGPKQQKQQQANFNDEIYKMREKVNDWKKNFKNNYNQKDFDKMVDEFSVKAEKLGKNLASTTVGIVDRMIDFVGSVVDTNFFNVFGSYNAVEKSFEADAAEGMDIYIEGINGHILVKKHLENKIIVKTKVRSPQNNADDILVYNNTGSAVSLTLNKIGNISVTHEVYLPAIKLGKIKLETTNGKIYVEDSTSEFFDAVTKNSNIDLMGVSSDYVNVNTKNARIQISYVVCNNIDINTTNSIIDVKNIKAQNVKALTTNGRIQIENVQNYADSTEANLVLKTSNGGIKVNMNDMENRAYKIKATTTNGGINLLIPELIYHNVNKQMSGASFVEAESNGYSNYSGKVNIAAETINGYIDVVK